MLTKSFNTTLIGNVYKSYIRKSIFLSFILIFCLTGCIGLNSKAADSKTSEITLPELFYSMMEPVGTSMKQSTERAKSMEGKEIKVAMPAGNVQPVLNLVYRSEDFSEKGATSAGQALYVGCNNLYDIECPLNSWYQSFKDFGKLKFTYISHDNEGKWPYTYWLVEAEGKYPAIFAGIEQPYDNNVYGFREWSFMSRASKSMIAKAKAKAKKKSKKLSRLDVMYFPSSY